MSNNSPRNCKLNLSDTFVFLMTEKSALTKSGPVTALRLRLPGWQVVLTQGDANSVANTALVPNHAEGSPVTRIGPVTSGRTVRLIGVVIDVVVIDVVGFKGLPVCA